MKSPILFFLVFLMVLPVGAAPNVLVTSFDPDNVICNSEFILSNMLDGANITYIQHNVTVGRIYKIYNSTTLTVYGSATATSDNVTINSTGITDGTYRVAEIGTEQINIIAWNQSNATCNGIVEITNCTPVTDINITITSNGEGNRYVVYTMPGYQISSQHAISGSNNTIQLSNIVDGEYRIARTGTETMLFTYWNTSNESTIGTFQLTNSTPFSRFEFTIHNTTKGSTYGLNQTWDNTTVKQVYASSKTTYMMHTGLLDGSYNFVVLAKESNSFIGAIGAFVTTAIAGYFLNRFGKKRRE